MNHLPNNYRPQLGLKNTESAIKIVKDNFERVLSEKLNLTRVSAPRFLSVGSGLQDDLAGTQVPVSFNVNFSDTKVEMVHSLAKWKRYKCKNYVPNTGVYADMDAIRKDENVSPIHSVYVDQWDWEKVIENRNLETLKSVVRDIYTAMLETEQFVTYLHRDYLKPRLPPRIEFIYSEDLECMYPSITPKEREDKIAQKFGAVFIIGIGNDLPISKKPHDLRAADYDDWITKTDYNHYGLNGDIIVYDDIREQSLELSSMGIRVNAISLEKQMKKMNTWQNKLPFHDLILNNRLPNTIGGGIGQSRLCMFLLHKAHIGEVQSSFWPQEVIDEFKTKNVPLL